MTKQATPKPTVSTTTAAAERTPVEPRETKIGKAIALFERKEGATLDEMIRASRSSDTLNLRNHDLRLSHDLLHSAVIRAKSCSRGLGSVLATNA